MRTNILSLAICAAAMLPMYSCNDDKPLPPAEEKTGSLDLSSLGVEVEEKENEAESRAVADLSDFIIKISNNATGTAVKEWKYAETPEVMTLPVGKYNIDVEATNSKNQAGTARITSARKHSRLPSQKLPT